MAPADISDLFGNPAYTTGGRDECSRPLRLHLLLAARALYVSAKTGMDAWRARQGYSARNISLIGSSEGFGGPPKPHRDTQRQLSRGIDVGMLTLELGMGRLSALL